MATLGVSHRMSSLTQIAVFLGHLNLPSLRVGKSSYWLRLRRGAFTCVGWQVTLCDPIWQVASRSYIRDLHPFLPFVTFLVHTTQACSGDVRLRMLRVFNSVAFLAPREAFTIDRNSYLKHSLIELIIHCVYVSAVCIGT